MVGGEGDPTTGKLRIKKSKYLTGIAIHHSGNRLIVGSWVRGTANEDSRNAPCNCRWRRRRAVAVSVIDIGGFQYRGKIKMTNKPKYKSRLVCPEMGIWGGGRGGLLNSSKEEEGDSTLLGVGS